MRQGEPGLVPPRIEFRGVTKRFPPRDRSGEPLTAIEDVSFAVVDGEIVSLIGPSGCGKSTLLGLGAGLTLPSAGGVYIDGERISAPGGSVALMLQKDLLLPWRTIRENVEFGLEIKRLPADERRSRALAQLARFRLDGFADHYPYQLSGGMRQRAAMARTLAVDPALLLMDEPFSTIDAQTKMALHQDLAESLAATGKTALFITHDLLESIVLSDRVVVMSARPGRIIETIPVDLPERHNPALRRKDARVGDYVERLMELLHVEGG